MAKPKPPKVLQDLEDVEILELVADCCKIKAVIDALTALLKEKALEVLLRARWTKSRIPTPYGFIMKYSGKQSQVLSAVGKAKMDLLKAELIASGDLTFETGDEYTATSATSSVNIAEILSRLNLK